jgi:hypothetical protein
MLKVAKSLGIGTGTVQPIASGIRICCSSDRAAERLRRHSAEQAFRPQPSASTSGLRKTSGPQSVAASKYGCKCAVCAITHRSLMKAAHICGKAHNGSDDWRNGLPLCSTHHDAFDAYLFVIQPKSLIIETMPGVSPSSIGITAKMLSPIHGQPARAPRAATRPRRHREA